MAGTETYGPFDSQPWADQTEWYRSAPVWAPSGVIDTPAASTSTGSLAITFSALTPTIAAGRAWVRGALYELSGGAKTMSAVTANSNSSLDRRDRIVLRRDLSAKTVALTWIQGTPASTPVAPALTQNETGQWDIPLFSFVVPHSSGTTITGIVDERVWVDPDGGQVHKPRQWYFTRTGNTSDTTAASSGAILMIADTISSAPTGDYEITCRQVIAGTVVGAGFQSITVNAVAIDAASGGARADILVAGGRHVFMESAGYTHTGGDMTVRGFYTGSVGGNITVWSQGTELTVKYLGPR